MTVGEVLQEVGDGAHLQIAATSHLPGDMFGYVPGCAYVQLQTADRGASLAAASRLPTLYGYREFPDEGGLMSYGANLASHYRHAADYVNKILRGGNPGDIPVEQPTKFDLIVNLKAAKALDLELSPSLLARADEVIE
jgi:hypothetical protein